MEPIFALMKEMVLSHSLSKEKRMEIIELLLTNKTTSNYFAPREYELDEFHKFTSLFYNILVYHHIQNDEELTKKVMDQYTSLKEDIVKSNFDLINASTNEEPANLPRYVFDKFNRAVSSGQRMDAIRTLLDYFGRDIISVEKCKEITDNHKRVSFD